MARLRGGRPYRLRITATSATPAAAAAKAVQRGCIAALLNALASITLTS